MTKAARHKKEKTGQSGMAKKAAKTRAAEKNFRAENSRQADGGFSQAFRRNLAGRGKAPADCEELGGRRKTGSGRLSRASDAYILEQTPLFCPQKLDAEARKILESFDDLVQGVRPLSPKQFHLLPYMIARLSHSLTDERGERRAGYMNEAGMLSAYARYFLWWNLVRLTRLFASFGEADFDLRQGDVCLDLGSGPLTVVTALWLAQPSLRKTRLTWYCVDISKSALALGEDLFLSVAAKTAPQFSENWKIVRVSGSLGTPLKQKASFVTCANMFNEIYQEGTEPPEFYAKKFSEALAGYAEKKPQRQAKFFVIEPGIPQTARFVSLMRDSFLRQKMSVQSPCPHTEACPMSGVSARRGGESKWCNFSFNTLQGDGSQKIYAEDIPARLQKLSEAAKLGKYRAVLSFVFAKTEAEEGQACGQGEGWEIALRVASEPIKLPHGEVGFYACSGLGLVLAVNNSRRTLRSGDLLKIRVNHGTDFCVDQKSGAKIIRLGD